MKDSFEQRLSGSYMQLSVKLKQAADFAIANPVDIATRSLRDVSKRADLSPATFSRMSRALGYDSYEDLRDLMRSSIGNGTTSFTDRITELQRRHDAGERDFGANHLIACATNLEYLHETINAVDLDQAVEHLHNARHVLVAGMLGSTGIAEHLSYMASFFTNNWSMASRMGASLASGLVGLSEQDAFILITKEPYATRSILAAQEAKACGAYVIVITDKHSSPALQFASVGFTVQTETPHFFSSYAATVVLAETIIGMLASRAGADARKRIAEVEDRNRRLETVWDG